MQNKLPSSIDSSFLAPLGKIIADFNSLEFLLSRMIELLLFRKPKSEEKDKEINIISCPDYNAGQIVTAELTFRDKINLFSSLYRYRFPEKSCLDNFKKLLKRLNDTNDERNNYTHSLMTKTGVQIRVSAKQKSGLQRKFEQKTIADLDNFSEQIAILTWDLQEFIIQSASTA